METIVFVAPHRLILLIKLKCPSCRFPIVGTKPTTSLFCFQDRTSAFKSDKFSETISILFERVFICGVF